MNPIYLDNNATTPLAPAVFEAMRPFFFDTAGNPASAHAPGRKARQAVEDAREQIAALLDASPDEVLFTSGATEANNLALFGLAGAREALTQPRSRPGRVIVSPIEHPSVAEPVRRLELHGFRIDRLPVDAVGLTSPANLASLLQPDTRLVALQLANNETGVIQPVAELSRQLPTNALCHCDAAQAAGKIPVSFRQLGVASLSISGHKFHGPQGIGALLVRRGVRLEPLFWGGQQQQGRRPGTEPVALSVGLAKALEVCCQEMQQRAQRLLTLRRLFLTGLQAQAAPVVINGPVEGGPGFGLPHTLNLSFPGCQADTLLIKLDLAGVACSTGSACSSGSLLPSPVLQAMRVEPDCLHSAMRFSLGPALSEQEVAEAVRRIALCCSRLRHGSSIN